MKTLTIAVQKVVPLCIFLIILSGCSVTPNSLVNLTDSLVNGNQPSCSQMIKVSISSEIKNNTVEKAISDSQCLLIVKRGGLKLTYSVNTDAVTKTKGFLQHGRTSANFGFIGKMVKGSRVEILLTDKGSVWKGIGEDTSSVLFVNETDATYTATQKAIIHLLSMKMRK